MQQVGLARGAAQILVRAGPASGEDSANPTSDRAGRGIVATFGGGAELPRL